MSVQARPGDAGWPENSPTRLASLSSTGGLTARQKAAFGSRVLLDNALSEGITRDGPADQNESSDDTPPEDTTASTSSTAQELTPFERELINSLVSVLSDHALSEDSTQDTPAHQDESSNDSPPEETSPSTSSTAQELTPFEHELIDSLVSVVGAYAMSEDTTEDTPADQDESGNNTPPEEPPASTSSAAQQLTPSDLELINSVVSVLGAHAFKYNIGPKITIGPQPARDLTTPGPELFNSLGSAILAYAQKHQGWGTCTEDQSCNLTLTDHPKELWVAFCWYMGGFFLFLCVVCCCSGKQSGGTWHP